MIFSWRPKDFLSEGNQKKPKGKPKEIQRNSRGSLKKFKGPRGIQRKAKKGKSKGSLKEIQSKSIRNPQESKRRKFEGTPKEIKMKGTGCLWNVAS